MEVTEPAHASPSPRPSDRVSEVYSWASQLTSESRRVDWIAYWYVWPDAVGRILRQLDVMEGGMIGLVGRQGVGKSSALLAIITGKIILQEDARRKQRGKSDADDQRGYDTVLFKWRRRAELFASLLDGTHEAAAGFRREYASRLLVELEARYPLLDLKEVKAHPESLNIEWAEANLGRARAKQGRQVAWLEMLQKKRTILIDMPDYSKTDRRLMARDLEEIYWLWNFLSKQSSLDSDTKPNLVVAIQKEMFRDHFFFDKMQRVELEPLEPEQMLEAYRKRLKTTEPFTEDALLTLARMSRGIFRRFLRYVTSSLDNWRAQPEPRGQIDLPTVKRAVTTERLAEDMELELLELFPKHSDLRLEAVRLLMLLEESGPKKQSDLVEELGTERYAMSRLLRKLELHRYVTRERTGTDKLVALTGTR